METKYTPGPWKVDEPYWDRIVAAGGSFRYGIVIAYATKMGGKSSTFWPEPQANARLIAKAWLIPEVEETLTYITRLIGDLENLTSYEQSILAKVKPLLAKLQA